MPANKLSPLDRVFIRDAQENGLAAIGTLHSHFGVSSKYIRLLQKVTVDARDVIVQLELLSEDLRKCNSCCRDYAGIHDRCPECNAPQYLFYENSTMRNYVAISSQSIANSLAQLVILGRALDFQEEASCVILGNYMKEIFKVKSEQLFRMRHQPSKTRDGQEISLLKPCALTLPNCVEPTERIQGVGGRPRSRERGDALDLLKNVPQIKRVLGKGNNRNE